MARMSPRQRMINLMRYIVLTAMLALNVSSDVLNGFSQVQEGIHQTNLNMSKRNTVQFEYLKGLYRKNPEKAGQWYEKGAELRKRSGSVYDEIEALKTAIARKEPTEPMETTSRHTQQRRPRSGIGDHAQSGHAPRRETPQGCRRFREYVVKLIPDPAKRKGAVVEMLSTTVRDTPRDCRRHVVGNRRCSTTCRP